MCTIRLQFGVLIFSVTNDLFLNNYFVFQKML